MMLKFSGERFSLYQGDCLEVMRDMDDSSVDSVVTDPPYGLSFMGKDWDHQVPGVAVWKEALRVLKPGGYLLAFGGSRTYHRMAVAIEDAGFEIRDQIMWIYGSGFPKSRNVAKMDMAGSPEATAWEGWGTALKPAHEPICMARKPLIGTVAENLLAHGTGAINIFSCRVPVDLDTDKSQLRTMNRNVRTSSDGWGMSTISGDAAQVVRQEGRWPANVIHDGSDEVLGAFPDAPGQSARVTGGEPTSNGFSGAVKFGGMIGRTQSCEPRGDVGSAARFFYCAKASRADRNAGCTELPDQAGGMNSNTSGQHITRRDGWMPAPVKNNHPTVKPTDLMAYLCRLVTAPGGVVLDPFMGSGSTGKACVREGFNFIGIELDKDACGNPLGYLEIAHARIEGVSSEAVMASCSQLGLRDDAA
ncbi:MAG: Modification methylase HindIII [Herbaspirillum frisingense]|uniref:Methyltransferase n=1 Tax=Herbaspirillum frisingense TaxID=92645 RepID=A0A7V8FVT3_9BURK|nr:MAG: Modification methylase HindIII [Herbaspirillum frisingense]